MSTSPDSDRAIGDAARALNSGVQLERLLDRLTFEVRATMALMLLRRGEPVRRNPDDELHIMEGPDADRRTIRQALMADKLGLRRCGPMMNETYRETAAFPGLSLWGRQTGRTTRMLLDALVDLSDGHRVVILAPSVSIGVFCVNWLRAMLQELAARGEWGAGQVPVTATGYVTTARDLQIVLDRAVGGGRLPRVHVDHTWDEFVGDRQRADALKVLADHGVRNRSHFTVQQGTWGMRETPPSAYREEPSPLADSGP